ncbi:MAG: carbohydrate binding domain-containing protein [Kiritimatiellae bacterium]|nr:carbohydrate binding domain-containing protein [Kiritimatiellia bacterium]MDD5519961.1 carbohydrate binding domain-containing protein [Kiritimatiellia bacterium]
MRYVLTLIMLGFVSGLSAVADMTPFVIPLKQNPSSAIAHKSEPINPDSPRIVVRDSHFAVAKQRIRIWGVNNSFGANLPSHEDAEKIAARMGAAGINSVRFHHMDTAAYPRGILDPKDPLKLSETALDRLDYFVDQLAKNGIYANINLHVGRSASRALKIPDPLTHYDKIVGIFTPELIEAQKQYARDLLGHVNKYRNIRYADDSAVAFVEITNEDSLFMWSAIQDLKSFPEFYQQILRTKYAAWLKSKYGSTKKLQKAWSQGSEPLGQNILAPDSIPQPNSKDKGWRLEQHGGCAAKMEKKADGILRVDISKANDTSWHIQAKQTPLSIKAGQYYTLSFKARADQPRSLSYGLGQDHAPWDSMGLNGNVKLTTEWKKFRMGFVARKDDDVVRLSFSLSKEKPSVEISEILLASGGREGLLADETIEKANIALFGESEVEARSIDRYRFLAEIEKAYFDEIKNFLKKELGVKALVTGTIVFGPCGLYGQSGMDFIDSHAYWQHPHFPGKPWDSGNWIVEQKAMVDHLSQATLPHIAAERMAGKPFTVSEYNHPAPNDFQAECVPMIAAFAAAQDWDGIWFYTHSHSNEDVDRSAFNSYFDIDANTAKWGFMRVGAAIFCGKGIPPLQRIREVGTGGDTDPVTQLAKLHMKFDRDSLAALQELMKDCDTNLTLRAQLKIDLNGKGQTIEGKSATDPELSWTTNEEGHGTFYAAGSAGKVLISHGMIDGPVNMNGLEITAPTFAALTMTSLDNQFFEKSKAILIAGCGRCENKGMIFSSDRRTVGRNWGTAPVEIEPVTGKVPLPAGNWTCSALNPDGTRGNEVKLGKDENGKTMLALSPDHKTMWYLVEKR